MSNPPASVPQHWDIFCQVIDNYGDIGTAWRLALQLQKEMGCHVRLWVDVLDALKMLVPATDVSAQCQTLQQIEVKQWTAAFVCPETLGEVVIEMFACELPQGYLQAMQSAAIAPIWVNLDYFSCESWVAGCHGLPSFHRSGLNKWFYFPGFSPIGGGLLREADLQQKRTDFWQSPQAISRWLEKNSLAPARANHFKVSLFAYENAALADLLTYLSQYPVEVYLPEGKLAHSLRQQAPFVNLQVGQSLDFGLLRVHLIAFLPQQEFDGLLRYCDLNFVRGEESLTRAIWAAKPFVWHIYPTEDQAHWPKLEAFLTEYDLPENIAEVTRDWNRQQLNQAHLEQLFNDLLATNSPCQSRVFALSEQRAAEPSLVKQLTSFIQTKKEC
ncbi:MAG: elongation factor P maturation arginine rhamnosyltransferase EarP [Thiotrichales bacterium]|nr:elongation factor P maturation arginine rhamnosyltransferase EarP [Thiotrichales bacterium]